MRTTCSKRPADAPNCEFCVVPAAVGRKPFKIRGRPSEDTAPRRGKLIFVDLNLIADLDIGVALRALTPGRGSGTPVAVLLAVTRRSSRRGETSAGVLLLVRVDRAGNLRDSTRCSPADHFMRVIDGSPAQDAVSGACGRWITHPDMVPRDGPVGRRARIVCRGCHRTPFPAPRFQSAGA